MIEGLIDKNLEARGRLPVHHAGETHEIDFLVDTGFNGYLAVPESIVRTLDLELKDIPSGITADGRAATSTPLTFTSLCTVAQRSSVLRSWMNRCWELECCEGVSYERFGNREVTLRSMSALNGMSDGESAMDANGVASSSQSGACFKGNR